MRRVGARVMSKTWLRALGVLSLISVLYWTQTAPAVPCATRDTPVMLLWQGERFGDFLPKDLERLKVTSVLPCDFKCELMWDCRRWREADLIVSHASLLGMQLEEPDKHRYGQCPAMPPGKCPSQRWAVFTQEHSLLQTGQQAVPWESFDIVATHQLFSDLPASYFRFHTRKQGASTATFNKQAVGTYIVSNCDKDFSGRSAYMVELMQHIEVHSYGACLHNKEWPERWQHVVSSDHDDRNAAKLDVLSSYKFHFAFENSRLPDYVTEKFYQPLIAGTVPVYLGAPNIAEYAPHPNSYIDASEYTPRDLAMLLTMLDTREEEYAKMHAWREDQDLVDAFVRRGEQTSSLSWFCRACDDILRRRALVDSCVHPQSVE